MANASWFQAASFASFSAAWFLFTFQVFKKKEKHLLCTHLRCISVFLLWSGSRDSRDLCMLTKRTVYTEQSKHRSVVRIHMNMKAFIHHQFCRKYEYHIYIYIYTYEFPSTLRLLLSPPIPNCNMLQHISHLRIQVTGDPTNMEPHKKKSHHFFCWKIQIRLVISQAVGFSYTNSTTNSLATVHLQCPMVFVVGYL